MIKVAIAEISIVVRYKTLEHQFKFISLRPSVPALFLLWLGQTKKLGSSTVQAQS